MAKTTVFMAEQLVTIDRQDILMKVGCVNKDSGVMEKINSVIKR